MPLRNFVLAGKSANKQLRCFCSITSTRSAHTRSFSRIGRIPRLIKRYRGQLGVASSSQPRADGDRLSEKEMRLVNQVDLPWFAHCILSLCPTCRRKCPRIMVDLASVQATFAIGAVEAVACRQPMLERARSSMEDFTGRSITCIKSGWRLTAMRSLTSVSDYL